MLIKIIIKNVLKPISRFIGKFIRETPFLVKMPALARYALCVPAIYGIGLFLGIIFEPIVNLKNTNFQNIGEAIRNMFTAEPIVSTAIVLAIPIIAYSGPKLALTIGITTPVIFTCFITGLAILTLWKSISDYSPQQALVPRCEGLCLI